MPNLSAQAQKFGIWMKNGFIGNAKSVIQIIDVTNSDPKNDKFWHIGSQFTYQRKKGLMTLGRNFENPATVYSYFDLCQASSIYC